VNEKVDMQTFNNFFSAPIYPDEETTRRAGLLSFLINLHIFVAVSTAFMLAVFTTMRPIFPVAALVSALPGLALRVLMRRGRVTQASILFVSILFLIMPAVAWFSDSSAATVPVTVFQTITIVMAGLLLGGRGAAVFVALTGAVNGALIYAELNGGYVTDTSLDLVSNWVMQVIAFSAITAMLYVTNRLLRESFARARRENEERRAAEADVRKKEQLYRNAIEAANAVPYYLNYAERTYDFMGSGILALTGYAPGEITQDIYNSLVKESHLLGEAAQYTVDEAYQHVRNGEIAVWKTDDLITRRDGEERWLMDSAVQVRNDRGEIIGAIGSLQDITERKQAEQQMQQHIHEMDVIHAVSQGATSELELNALFDLITHELFQLFDIQEIYFALRDQKAGLIRFPYYQHGDQHLETSPVPLGQGLSSHVILSRQPLLINQDYERRSAELGVVRFSTEPGSLDQVSWLGVPIQAGEQVIGVICVMNLEHTNAFTEADVRLLTTIASNVGIAIQNAQLYTAVQQELTERKRAEAEIRRLNAELEIRVRERTAELEIVNRDLESYSYSVSHDLRAPLRAINSFTRIIKDDFSNSMDPVGRGFLDKVIASGAKMNQLIDDLLDFSHINRKKLNKQEVDLRILVQSVIESLTLETANRKIEWTITELPSAQADPILIQQVYANLIGNAVKYSRKRESARIEVGSLPQHGETVYFVRDNGAGFDMRYADRLFGVFQRLHRDDEFEGTGIGLATVQRIIHGHGGRIWAEAEVNKGATFYFTL
jgi:PAS domain S-box-containing protein